MLPGFSSYDYGASSQQLLRVDVESRLPANSCDTETALGVPGCRWKVSGLSFNYGEHTLCEHDRGQALPDVLIPTMSSEREILQAESMADTVLRF